MATSVSLVIITLYKPDAAPEQIPATEFTDNLVVGGVLPVDRVAGLLGCHPSLVDTLASGPDYVMYSIFDHEGPINRPAMAVLTELTGVASDETNEDDVLSGNVLVIVMNP